MSFPQDMRAAGYLAGQGRLWVAALLLATLFIRSAVLWGMYGNLRDDPDAYRHIAHNLLAHGIYGRDWDGDESPIPTAYRPPLYPLVLSQVAAGNVAIPSLNIALFHAVLGVATVGATLLLGWRLGLQNWSYFAAGIVAVDPILLNQSALVMTETLAALLSALCLWSLVRFHAQRNPGNAALAGGLVGLAVLCRPTFLPWLLPVAAVVAWNSPGWLRGAMNVVALVGCAALVVAPWGVRNYQVFGKPIVATTHGGYTLALGNNESYYRWLREGKPHATWDAKNWVREIASHSPQRQHDELVNDANYHQLAHQAIADDPGMFAYSSAFRIAQLWSPLPNRIAADESNLRRSLRYAVALWYIALFGLALIAIVRGSSAGDQTGKHSAERLWSILANWLSSPWIYGVLLCLVFTALHSIYWSNLRMRAPLIPFVACVAAAGVQLLARKNRQTRSHNG